MKFSYSWIREFVEGLDVPAQALERLITMKTAECEGITTAGALLEGASPALVESVEPIAGSRNQKAVVDAGRYGRKTLVCGAKNCRAGLRTVYVPLAAKTISGVVSEGMLASAAELEIGREHEGILELRQGEELPEPDSIIEIDNKSITHRPDLWGHYGMAREVAAITGRPLRDRTRLDRLPGGAAPVAVVVADCGLCPRYSALVFENVTVGPSPLWLQARLTAVGLNPINNIVDLTNFIMAEMAQPMHAFDREKLAGGTIFVRPAKTGEKIHALNGETYSLQPSNLVIADAVGPIAVAGVIGGMDSAISAGTKTIVLESANFQASSVRRTSSALKLRTDASMRFEKAQDPLNTVRALARALELLPVISPGIRVVGGLADAASPPPALPVIPLDLDWLARKLGRVLEAAEVRRILESLGFAVTARFEVTVPSWRATKDVSMSEDLVEEVGRMIGYDSIEPTPPLVPCTPSFDPPEREFLRGVKRMVAAQGFTEVSNYSFIGEAEATRFGLRPEDHRRVLNPIAAGQELMRLSLLPGIVRNIEDNARHFDHFRLFEVGREIHQDGSEHVHLMAAVYAKDEGRTGLLELKRLAECLAPEVKAGPAVARPWEHPARVAELEWHGRVIGRFGELVDVERAAVLDVDLGLLQELTPQMAKYMPVRRFPTSAFDLSVITGLRELAGNVERRIRELAGDMAKEVTYVREYQGAPLPPDRKSLSFRIVVGAADRTLSSEEITEIRNRIIDGLSAHGYELRV